MGFLEPITLRGAHVALVPLTDDHHDDLVEAVRDGELWNLWYTIIPEPAKVRVEIERRLGLQAKGAALPFAVMDPAMGKAVGLTSYLNIDAANRRVEIGATWYRASLQRTSLNTEAKLLLLTHAFETLGAIRVEFKTDALNDKSRAALARIGAVEEGTFRNHMITQSGRVRDSVYFSILDREWPAVKARLQGLLR